MDAKSFFLKLLVGFLPNAVKQFLNKPLVAFVLGACTAASGYGAYGAPSEKLKAVSVGVSSLCGWLTYVAANPQPQPLVATDKDPS